MRHSLVRSLKHLSFDSIVVAVVVVCEWKTREKRGGGVASPVKSLRT